MLEHWTHRTGAEHSHPAAWESVVCFHSAASGSRWFAFTLLHLGVGDLFSLCCIWESVICFHSAASGSRWFVFTLLHLGVGDLFPLCCVGVGDLFSLCCIWESVICFHSAASGSRWFVFTLLHLAPLKVKICTCYFFLWNISWLTGSTCTESQSVHLQWHKDKVDSIGRNNFTLCSSTYTRKLWCNTWTYQHSLSASSAAKM